MRTPATPVRYSSKTPTMVCWGGWPGCWGRSLPWDSDHFPDMTYAVCWGCLLDEHGWIGLRRRRGPRAWLIRRLTGFGP